MWCANEVWHFILFTATGFFIKDNNDLSRAAESFFSNWFGYRHLNLAFTTFGVTRACSTIKKFSKAFLEIDGAKSPCYFSSSFLVWVIIFSQKIIFDEHTNSIFFIFAKIHEIIYSQWLSNNLNVGWSPRELFFKLKGNSKSTNINTLILCLFNSFLYLHLYFPCT